MIPQTDHLVLRRTLCYVVAAIITLGLLGYVLFQARFVIIGPQITLTAEPSVRQNQQHITLSGSTANISRLWLNDRPIYTDLQGNFDEAIILETGYTIVTIRAEDRYGRSTTLERSYVYTPATFIE